MVDGEGLNEKMQEEMNMEQRRNYELSKKLWVEFYQRLNREYLPLKEAKKYIEKAKEYKYWKGKGNTLIGLKSKARKSWKELLKEKIKQMEREKAMGEYFYYSEEEIQEGMNR